MPIGPVKRVEAAVQRRGCETQCKELLLEPFEPFLGRINKAVDTRSKLPPHQDCGPRRRSPKNAVRRSREPTRHISETQS